jgi:hypothetical protein
MRVETGHSHITLDAIRNTGEVISTTAKGRHMRKSHSYALPIVMLFVNSLPTITLAQSSACTALLAQGIRDTSSLQITEYRFNQIKSNVCNSNYDTFAKASSQAMNGGFDLPGVFGISFGSANANSDYTQKWSNFCQSDYSKAFQTLSYGVL